MTTTSSHPTSASPRLCGSSIPQSTDLPASVTHVMTIPVAQLQDELPIYDRGGLVVLKSALRELEAAPIPRKQQDRALHYNRMIIIRRRIEQIEKGK